ncbi:daunorubicin resistance protein DrrC [Pelomonas sp. Root1217]|uniref:ATP-binding cassette domain-containing protein n=1 Tax=Pelomonas sp. Root1217 TaxID=1736430 RepID=UPI00070F7656|nr:excinuclease ABC subunit UvrA [Pelomonas sp. Root1217]KQV48819.1 daunorubicin resistance protein DrrC [Pelomonas sp. Root1217]
MLKRPSPSTDFIHVVGARENNLRNVSVDIPKKRITVFTGVSGSGKSSLVFDTIAAESQRQLNDTFSTFVRHRLPHHAQPDADVLENLCASIVIDQRRLGGNARSTVGTATDILALIRLLFSRVGQPFVGYSNIFSFNHPDGMCPRCEGLGKVDTIDVDRLFDRQRSLNQGAIRFSAFAVGGYRWKRYVHSGLFDNDKPLKDYTDEEWKTLLHAQDVPILNPGPGWPPTSRYEGVLPRIRRNFLTRSISEVKGLDRSEWDRLVTAGPCPRCHGARLNEKVLGCRIDGRNIADWCAMEVGELLAVIDEVDAPLAASMVPALAYRVQHLVDIGLGYLSLGRETTSLSGGESQRVKMVRHLGSGLSDMSYIFDEPSVGLHPRDVARLNKLLRHLCDKGNTVLVVEHDPDIIVAADHVIDMGPGAGDAGGTVVFEGDVQALRQADTPTGRSLSRAARINTTPRTPSGWLPITHATQHNLKDVSVSIPMGVLTVVTGVAGSGKSSLINAAFARTYPEVVCIDQGAITGSRRSNTATYTGILGPIRSLFAQANAASASLFSANSGGACPVCKGLGTTETDLAFMEPIVSICERCQGRRFTEEALQFRLRGKNIAEVLAMRVAEASAFFAEPEIAPALARLEEVGLAYLSLGQPLSSLSGGERQRLKLATELGQSGRIYVFDEPTSGLHLSDIDRLFRLLDQLIDRGATVVVIEHQLDMIARADWLIDMGPEAGQRGGRVVFEGAVAEMVARGIGETATHLRRYANSQGSGSAQ